jgi:hypothetical protein
VIAGTIKFLFIYKLFFPELNIFFSLGVGNSGTAGWALYDIDVVILEKCQVHSTIDMTTGESCVCNEGYYQQNAISQASTFFGGNFNKKCSPCPTLCLTCDKNGACTKCLGDFPLINGVCQLKDG